MAAIREFFVALGLETDKGAFSVAEAAIAGLKKGLVGVGVGLGAVAVAFGAAVKETVDAASEIKDVSDRTGIATDTLQELKYAAAQSGVEFGTLVQSLQILGKNLAGAGDEGKAQEKAFGDLGLSIRDANGELKATDVLLMESADAFKAMKNPTEQGALAMKLFGKSGTVLLPLLKEGAAGINALRERARLLGAVMDEETVGAGEALGDTLDDVGTAAKGLTFAMAGPLLKPIRRVLNIFAEWLATNRSIIKSNVKVAVRVLTVAFKALAWVLTPVTWTLGKMLKHWKLFAALLGGVVLVAIGANIGAIATLSGWYLILGAGMIAMGVKAAFGWFMATWPALLLIAAIALVILAIEDVWTTLNGGEGLLTDIIADFGLMARKWIGESSADDGWLTNALKAVAQLVADFPKSLDVALDYYRKQFSDFVDWLGRTVRSIPGMSAILDGFSAESMLGNPEARKAAADAADRAFNAGGMSPAGSAQFSPSAVNSTTANSVTAAFTVNAAPGQNAEEVAGAVQKQMDNFWDSKLSAAAPQVQ